MEGASEHSLVTVSTEVDHGPRKVSKELDVTFVLCNILEVPEVQLEDYLKHLGDPLEGWSMELCGNCEDVVIRAKRIYQEMVDAKRRFKEVKFEIISKIMSIQQGIKCGNKEPEIGTEFSESGGRAYCNLEDPGKAASEQGDEVTGLVDNGNQVNINPHQGFSSSEERDELEKEEDDNMLEFEYHFKTEEPFYTGGVGTDEDPGVLENVLESSDNSTLSKVRSKQDLKSSLKGKRKQTQVSDPLGISKDSSTLHGLEMKGRKKLPKRLEGPVQCKCGREFSQYNSLLRHVREILKGPEELVRCEICFESNPSTVVTFKRQEILNRHIQTVHQRKLSSCPRCGSRMRSDLIKRHLKSCRKGKR